MAEKRISLFIPTLEVGGAERVAVNLAKGFIDQGLQVDLVLVKARGPLMKLVPKSVAIVDLGKRRTLHAIPDLVTYLKSAQPNALIAFMNHANVVAAIAASWARSKGKLVLSEHNSIQHDLVEKGGLKHRLTLWLMRRLYGKADKVIAVSTHIQYELEKLIGLTNAVCINNPISIVNGTDMPPMVKMRPRPNVAGDFSLLAIGRLAPQKNYSLLIKSIDIVRKHVPVKLVILGEGDERSKLEMLVRELDLEDHVFLPGYAEKPGMWFSKTDLFVLSSSWEGLPLVIAEALAMGVTVVATDCQSGPAEILENGKYGYLVPVNDPEKLAKAIMYALKNPLDPEMLKKRAEDFSIPRITDEYLKVIFPEEL